MATIFVDREPMLIETEHKEVILCMELTIDGTPVGCKYKKVSRSKSNDAKALKLSKGSVWSLSKISQEKLHPSFHSYEVFKVINLYEND